MTVLWLLLGEFVFACMWLGRPSLAGLWLGGLLGSGLLGLGYSRVAIDAWFVRLPVLKNYLWFLPLSSLGWFLALGLMLAVATNAWPMWLVAIGAYAFARWRCLVIPPLHRADMHKIVVLFVAGLGASALKYQLYDSKMISTVALFLVVLLPILVISALLIRMFNQGRWRRQVRS